MVLLNALGALFSLDIGFFVDIFADKLVWVLLFYTVGHVLSKGKNTLYWFFLVTFYVWALLSFKASWGFSTGLSFPLLFFIYTMAVEHFVALPKLFGNLTPFFEIGGFYALITGFTFFLR